MMVIKWLHVTVYVYMSLGTGISTVYRMHIMLNMQRTYYITC